MARDGYWVITYLCGQCSASGSFHRIHMFWGLPEPDPLVRRVDPDPALAPDPDPSIILLSSSKNSEKNLDSYCFVTSFGLFIFEKWCKCTFKRYRNKQKNFFLNLFCLASWRSVTKLQDPDPLQIMNPEYYAIRYWQVLINFYFSLSWPFYLNIFTSVPRRLFITALQ